MKIIRIKSTDKLIIMLGEKVPENMELTKIFADRLKDKFNNDFVFIPSDSQIIVVEE